MLALNSCRVHYCSAVIRYPPPHNTESDNEQKPEEEEQSMSMEDEIHEMHTVPKTMTGQEKPKQAESTNDE